MVKVIRRVCCCARDRFVSSGGSNNNKSHKEAIRDLIAACINALASSGIGVSMAVYFCTRDSLTKAVEPSYACCISERIICNVGLQFHTLGILSLVS